MFLSSWAATCQHQPPASGGERNERVTGLVTLAGWRRVTPVTCHVSRGLHHPRVTALLCVRQVLHRARPPVRCTALIRTRVWSFKSAWSGMCRHHDIMTPHTIIWHHYTSYYNIMTPHTTTSWHLILQHIDTSYCDRNDLLLWHHDTSYW